MSTMLQPARSVNGIPILGTANCRVPQTDPSMWPAWTDQDQWVANDRDDDATDHTPDDGPSAEDWRVYCEWSRQLDEAASQRVSEDLDRVLATLPRTVQVEAQAVSDLFGTVPRCPGRTTRRLGRSWLRLGILSRPGGAVAAGPSPPTACATIVSSRRKSSLQTAPRPSCYLREDQDAFRDIEATQQPPGPPAPWRASWGVTDDYRSGFCLPQRSAVVNPVAVSVVPCRAVPPFPPTATDRSFSIGAGRCGFSRTARRKHVLTG
jgi:hypothetical protein